MDYNYFEAIKEDVKEYLKETSERDFDTLYDEMFVDDSITGNASGSYTFSTWQAEENIAHNMDLLKEALEEFGGDYGEALEKGAEYCDVTIRCYLLGQVLQEVLEELEEEEEQKGSGTNEKKNRKENKKNTTKNQLYIIIYNFTMSIYKLKYLDFKQLYYNNKIKKEVFKMRKIIVLLISILLTIILTTITIFYSLKITNVENGNITINIFGFEEVYYFEK